MSKALCRQSGLYQWDAKVSCTRPGHQHKKVSITVFSDTREDAIRDACREVGRMGYASCSVDHIVRIG